MSMMPADVSPPLSLSPVGRSWAAGVSKPVFVPARAETARQMRTASASSKCPTAQRMVMVRSAVSSWQSWADGAVWVLVPQGHSGAVHGGRRALDVCSPRVNPPKN